MSNSQGTELTSHPGQSRNDSPGHFGPSLVVNTIPLFYQVDTLIVFTRNGNLKHVFTVNPKPKTRVNDSHQNAPSFHITSAPSK